MKPVRKAARHKFRFKKGDIVLCIAGEDRGKRGKVLEMLPGSERALVEGLNLVKRHLRKSQENPKGRIVEREASIHVSNLRKLSESGEKKGKAS